MLQSKDKVVVVAGGGAGIGLALADAFARSGARATLLARDEPRLACASSWKKSDPHARQALGKDPLLFTSPNTSRLSWT